VDDNNYQLSPQIRDRVRFGVHNLIRDTFPCQNDIVFCRNVAIYFSEAQKKGLYEKLQGSLRQDGVLVLGSAESLSGYLGNFIIREYGLGRYYELNASQVFMF
jgi:chemotaxis protein methyltransferase CheR